MSDTYFDGNFQVPLLCSPIVPEWLEEERSRIWRARLTARVGWWVKYNWGATIAGMSGKLVENGPPQVVGADVVEWDVTTAEVPPQRIVPILTAYTYQFVQSGELVEIAGPVTARGTFDYFETSNPFVITRLNARRKVQVATTIYTIGDAPPNSGWLMVEDDQLRRWRGNIWERLRTEVLSTSIT